MTNQAQLLSCCNLQVFTCRETVQSRGSGFHSFSLVSYNVISRYLDTCLILLYMILSVQNSKVFPGLRHSQQNYSFTHTFYSIEHTESQLFVYMYNLLAPWGRNYVLFTFPRHPPAPNIVPGIEKSLSKNLLNKQLTNYEQCHIFSNNQINFYLYRVPRNISLL